MLPECLQIRMTTSTKMASSRFSTEPKSCAVLPPPKEFTPTEIRLKPMESTTVPVTTEGSSCAAASKAEHCLKQAAENGRAHDCAVGQYAAAHRGCDRTEYPMKPEEVPMMIGTLPPMGPMEYS